MRVLITGSEGSLAQSLIPLLVADGHEVIGVDNLLRYGARQARSSSVEYEYHPIGVGTTAFDKFMFENADRFEVVFHLAAQIYGVGGFNKHRADILAKDISITSALYDSLIKYQKVKRVVFVSSSMVYECLDTSREDDVDDSIVMRTDYGLSKYTNERIVRAYQAQYGIPFTIWRPFNIITPYEEVRDGDEIGHGHVFADLIDSIIRKKRDKIPIMGDGRQTRCFTWHLDVAAAIAQNFYSDKTINDTFNLGSIEEISVIELATIIRRIGNDLGLIKSRGPIVFEHLPAHPNDVRRRVPDMTKSREVLGFVAKTSLEESVRECLLINRS